MFCESVCVKMCWHYLGSGKSTLTRAIADVYGHDKTQICASDDYFVDLQTNEYKFDKTKLEEAHRYAEVKAETACKWE